MTREERLNTCGRCLHRSLDFNHGYLCNLTGKEGDFVDHCKDFTRDGTVTDSLKLRVRQRVTKPTAIPEPAGAPAEKTGATSGRARKKLSQDARRKLKKYQSFLYALLGGIIATAAISVAWAFAAEMVSFPEIYLALGVGLLTGLVIRFFGAGIHGFFGLLGALFTLLGCILGSYFSRTELPAQVAATGIKDALALLGPDLVLNSVMETFVPLDLVFYGLALLLGYLLSIRWIGSGRRAKLNRGEGSGAPVFHWLRLPLIIAGIVVPAYFGYTQMRGESGWSENYYESGQKMSEGELMQQAETGKWSYWYENGNLKCTGYYTEGTRDSLWRWYDESGRRLLKSGAYQKGLEHGSWVNYHSNGVISDSGSYVDGNREGPWKYWHENGRISMEGEWSNGARSGRWIFYYNNRQQAEEVYYQDGRPLLIESVWDREGQQLVSGGNGEYKRFSDNGILIESGEIEDGSRTGIWKCYFENGNIREEGIYMDGRFLVRNSWDPDGTREVREGNGTYHRYHGDTKRVLEQGEIRNGNREGVWKGYYSESGNLKEEVEYDRGERSGPNKLYYESGQLRASGTMVSGVREDEWQWFHEDGRVSVTVTFKNGKKHGKQIRSNARGIIVQEEYYEAGVLL